MDKKHIGAYSELLACSWLLNQGFDVFRNQSPHGYADLVAIDMNTQEVILIDVKTAVVYLRNDGTKGIYTSKLSEEQTIRGIKPIVVIKDTGEVMWGEYP